MSTKQKSSHCFPYSVNKGPTVKRKKNHNKDWTETSELVSSKEEILLKTYKLSANVRQRFQSLPALMRMYPEAPHTKIVQRSSISSKLQRITPLVNAVTL